MVGDIKMLKEYSFLWYRRFFIDNLSDKSVTDDKITEDHENINMDLYMPKKCMKNLRKNTRWGVQFMSIFDTFNIDTGTDISSHNGNNNGLSQINSNLSIKKITFDTGNSKNSLYNNKNNISSYQPSSQPSSQKLSQPSSQPTRQPRNQPPSQPPSQPPNQPLSMPTPQVSIQPSVNPSFQLLSRFTHQNLQSNCTSVSYTPPQSPRAPQKPGTILKTHSTPSDFNTFSPMRMDIGGLNIPLQLNHTLLVLDSTPLELGNTHLVLDSTPLELGNTPLVLDSTPLTLDNTSVVLDHHSFGLNHTPLVLGSTPLVLDQPSSVLSHKKHTPIGLDHTPFELDHIHTELGNTPLDLNHTSLLSNNESKSTNLLSHQNLPIDQRVSLQGFERDLTGVSGAGSSQGFERDLTGVSGAGSSQGFERDLTAVSGAGSLQGFERDLTGVSGTGSLRLRAKDLVAEGIDFHCDSNIVRYVLNE
jgi:hypothetical protein